MLFLSSFMMLFKSPAISTITPHFSLTVSAARVGQVEGLLAQVAAVAEGARRHQRPQLVGVRRRRGVGQRERPSIGRSDRGLNRQDANEICRDNRSRVFNNY